MFATIYPSHNYETRQRDQPVVAGGKTSLTDSSLRFSLPREIENTPQQILDKVSTHSFAGYSNYIKQHFINNYSPVCAIQNWYICNRPTV